MKEDVWRQETLAQLEKDFRLSGQSLNLDHTPKDLDALVAAVADAIQSMALSHGDWDNLNYRIDLPDKVDLDQLGLTERVQLYLFRSFQKVWIRKLFGNAASKDHGAQQQKHLKP